MVTVLEWCAMIQTAAVVVSGAVVFWYTRETAQIRRASTQQAALLAEQVEMMRQQRVDERAEAARALARFEQETAAQRHAARPIFRTGGGQFNGDGDGFLRFINDGAPVSDVAGEVVALDGTVQPMSYPGKGELVTVQVRRVPSPRPDEMRVDLSYSDGRGTRSQCGVRYFFDGRPVETTYAG